MIIFKIQYIKGFRSVAAAVVLAACGGSAADGTEPPDGAGAIAEDTIQLSSDQRQNKIA